MAFVTIEEFKAHCRIDHDDEDAAAESTIESACDYVNSFLPEPIEDGDSPPPDVPAPLKQAALLIAAAWWDNRENAAVDVMTEIPLGAHELLVNYRGFAF